jgi:hypothetical protein
MLDKECQNLSNCREKGIAEVREACVCREQEYVAFVAEEDEHS